MKRLIVFLLLIIFYTSISYAQMDKGGELLDKINNAPNLNEDLINELKNQHRLSDFRYHVFLLYEAAIRKDPNNLRLRYYSLNNLIEEYYFDINDIVQQMPRPKYYEYNLGKDVDRILLLDPYSTEGKFAKIIKKIFHDEDGSEIYQELKNLQYDMKDNLLINLHLALYAQDNDPNGARASIRYLTDAIDNYDYIYSHTDLPCRGDAKVWLYYFRAMYRGSIGDKAGARSDLGQCLILPDDFTYKLYQLNR